MWIDFLVRMVRTSFKAVKWGVYYEIVIFCKMNKNSCDLMNAIQNNV